MPGPTESESLGPQVWVCFKSFPRDANVWPAWELRVHHQHSKRFAWVSQEWCRLQPDHPFPRVCTEGRPCKRCVDWAHDTGGSRQITPMTLHQVWPSTNWAEHSKIITLRLQNSLIWNLYSGICTTSSDNIILQSWKIISRATESILNSHILYKIRADKMHHKLNGSWWDYSFALLGCQKSHLPRLC